VALEVGKVVRNYVRRRRLTDKPERSVTFSLRLTEGQNAKLRFLAESFGDTKSTVAQRLLDAAMEDALRAMGSNEVQESDPDRANKAIDEKVEGYRDEIQRIFEEDIKQQG
jgi:predicted DNA-binding protein